MKKIIAILAVLVVLFAFFGGCAVNSTTGGITVVNQTDKDAANVKVGTVFIGFVGKGTSTTVYFTKEESTAQVNADGFSAAPSTKKGTIDLKFNYSYTLNLTYSGAGGYEYYYGITGTKLGAKSTDSDYNINMN